MVQHCRICGRRFKNLKALKIHVNQAHIKGGFQKRLNVIDGYYRCAICGARFKNRSSLKKHAVILTKLGKH